MKNAIVWITCIMFVTTMFSCKKGDTGPRGTAGADGLNGVDGNANVKQYSFGEQKLATNSYVQLKITTTKDTMENSAWFGYLYYQPLQRWYSIPGFGLGSATQYRVSMDHFDNKANFYIDRVGPGENYAQAKIVRIYTGAPIPGGRTATGASRLPDIDFTNYEAVRDYYQLPR